MTVMLSCAPDFSRNHLSFLISKACMGYGKRCALRFADRPWLVFASLVLLYAKRVPISGTLFAWSRVRESVRSRFGRPLRAVPAQTFVLRLRRRQRLTRLCRSCDERRPFRPCSLLYSHPSKKQAPHSGCLFFGAGYGNRTRLCGLGSDRSTDELTLHAFYYSTTISGWQPQIFISYPSSARSF